MLTKVFIALGSNVGDRNYYLSQAIAYLNENDHVELIAQSSFIETLPEGNISQPKFLNGVVELSTILSHREIFDLTLEIEKKLGRTSKGNRDPRTIDLDILLYGDQIISEEDLIIPHPLLHTRQFVLQPLCELVPHLNHPIIGESFLSLLAMNSGY